MNKAELIKLEIKLRKAYRSAFFCGVLVVMAAVAIVMVSLIAGQPVDQKAVAQDWTPLIMLMAFIAGSCHFFHAGVKEKIRKLDR
ncbi:hypothetical protein [Pseudomonas coleopterorum]|uniref:hypothetical protein n=1 Tax=Pseudomonas coleopterorum TaxID=1605838 RepID=UPI00178275C6|nr:hypothetical protein [Pseudomonas coleopterorum]MBD8483921.1 hypothetical protein [Pseudomonas coleopterorum]